MTLGLKRSIVALAVGALAAYTAGLRSARGGPCYTLTNPQNGCGGCAVQSCAPCDSGSCSGKMKLCNQSFTLHGDQAEGYLQCYQLGFCCWSTYTCIPLDPGPCSDPDNPCWLGSRTGDSLAHFSTYLCNGSCGTRG